jgi:hypothetical protein
MTDISKVGLQILAERIDLAFAKFGLDKLYGPAERHGVVEWAGAVRPDPTQRLRFYVSVAARPLRDDDPDADEDAVVIAPAIAAKESPDRGVRSDGVPSEVIANIHKWSDLQIDDSIGKALSAVLSSQMRSRLVRKLEEDKKSEAAGRLRPIQAIVGRTPFS